MDCACQNPPFSHSNFDRVDIGRDSMGEVEILTCKKCGGRWVKYLIEEEHHSHSGRWWWAEILDASVLTAENAKEYIERQEWCFVGGSFYGGIHKRLKPIVI